MSQADTLENHLTATFLKAADIPVAIEFIESVRAKQSEGNKHHLKPKTAEQLQAILADGGTMIGIQDEDHNLAGFSLINPANADLAILESVCISPENRGKGLGNILLDLAEAWASSTGFTTLRAKVAQDNCKSLKLFSGTGYQEHLAAHDATGHYDYFLMQKNLG